MEVKDVLVIGAGIAGCAVALALAKRGIPVTILTSSFDQRCYHAPFLAPESLEGHVQALQQDPFTQLSCSRAHEQLVKLAKKSIDELLEPHVLLDRHGNIDIHRCLQEQLKQMRHVEWASHHSVVELLTLAHHSLKHTDRYRKPTCLGAMAYNYTTQKLEYFFAKETILATGGASSLFPYSSHFASACGDGIAIAHRAEARLVNMDQVQFHPLGLFAKSHPCVPLPLELLAEGGKIYATKPNALELDFSSPLHLLHQLYDQLAVTQSEHLWLDLTPLDAVALKEKFSFIDACCLQHGFNMVKDPLPIVPFARYTCGGIAVDRFAQTSVQRLRAIGEVACTGLFWNCKEEALRVLESLSWAIACAEDIAKQITKWIYYFPEIREHSIPPLTSPAAVQEDWQILRHLMWSYVGIKQDASRLERGAALLEELFRLNALHDWASCSIKQIQLFHAMQTARLIVHSKRSRQSVFTHPFAFSHGVQEYASC